MTDVKFLPNIAEYYKQFPDYSKPLWDARFITSKIPMLKRDLEKIGVTLYYTIWNEWAFKAGIFETEYFHEDFIPINKTNYIVISEKRLYLDSTKIEGIAHIYSYINSDKIEQFNKIFIPYFLNRTEGVKSTNVISINIKSENTQTNNVSRSYNNIIDNRMNIASTYKNHNIIDNRMNIASTYKNTGRSKRRKTSGSKRRKTSGSKRRKPRKTNRSKRRTKSRNTRRKG
jgi:hypothetical protein